MDPLPSIDIILLSKNEEIVLITRNKEPEKNKLALIGGLQQHFESFENSIERILKQRLGLNSKVQNNKITFNNSEFKIKQTKTYGSGPDLRGGNVTVFVIETDLEKEELKKIISNPHSYISKDKLPQLAFEHNKFIDDYFFEFKNYTIAQNQGIGLTVDIVIVTVQDKILKVLLGKRSKEPFKNFYTLPGGFVDKTKSLDETAKEKLTRDTNIKNVYLEQLYTFSEVNRDPRSRIISTAYYALLDHSHMELISSLKYNSLQWLTLSEIKKSNLAFDHKKILTAALERIQNKIEYTNIAFQLLPEKFTLAELQEVYETILNKDIDKRNFRKKILELDMLEELNEFKKQGRMRPAKYHRFKERTKETPLKAKKWI